MGGRMRGWLNWFWDESDSDSDTERSERSSPRQLSVWPDPLAEDRTLLYLIETQHQVVEKFVFCKRALDDKDIEVLTEAAEVFEIMTRWIWNLRGIPVALTETLVGSGGESLLRSVQLVQQLKDTKAVPRTAKALKAAMAMLQATVEAGVGTDGRDQHVCEITLACLCKLMLAGRTLRRTAIATFTGTLAARTPVPGGGGATVADSAAELLYQLTAPELAVPLAGVLKATRCGFAAAHKLATTLKTPLGPCLVAGKANAAEIARRQKEIQSRLDMRSRLDMLNQLSGPLADIMKAACEVVYEVLACSYLAARVQGQQFQIAGGDSLLSAAKPRARSGLPNLLAAHRLLLSSLAASSLVDVMAGAVLSLPPPPAGVPCAAATKQSYRFAIQCAATSTAHLATIGCSLAASAAQHPPGAAAPAAAEAAALACKSAALVSAPETLRLQRALLERWLIIQVPAMAEAAVAEAAAAEAKAKAEAEGLAHGCPKRRSAPRMLSLEAALQQRCLADRAAAAASCGEPVLDRVLVLREVVQGPLKDESFVLGLDMLVQVEPLLSTLLLLRSGVCLSGAGKRAAAAPLPSLARAPECAALLARVMEAACGVERAGGRLGMQEWSLRVVKMAGAVLRGMWRLPDLTPASELLDAVPSATEALWWGLGAVVAETRRPGDPNALSASDPVKSISITLLKALEALVNGEASGLRALDAGARGALSSRLRACDWPRTAHSLLRLQEARRPKGAPNATTALIGKVMPSFL
ncbi:hypothetical protein HYH03_002414 [Edaphochlamys debaryana]|uniref:Uncharacterized protein n=1 Tax=Edaphochlamys debaryana TaxID=47281 RepID=A0A836C578_9CHLO|nr:hypothetical protein HYH03_002414 [Edaphochlamys debaryana]|eukprot:KAG2499467.1 hypothetical protein HYH03_002414 [Edaphochlamys debaryana]